MLDSWRLVLYVCSSLLDQQAEQAVPDYNCTYSSENKVDDSSNKSEVSKGSDFRW